MKKFIFKNIILLSSILVCYISLELLMLAMPNEYKAKIKNFENSLAEIEVLILGSSHALRGINPNKFENNKAYSMAMVSQPLQLDYRIFDSYKDELKSLKTLIITISHFSLSTNINDGDIGKRLIFYKRFYDIKTESNLINLDLKDYSIIAGTGLLDAIEDVVKYYILGIEKEIKCDESGYLGEGGKRPKNLRQEKIYAKEAAERHSNENIDFRKNIQLLNRIIDYCKNNNINVLIIETPKQNIYNELLSQDKEKLINENLSRLSNANSVYYKDYTNLFLGKKELFRNADHLNEMGANLFTQILEQELNEFN